MIDINKPLELADGTPVEFVRFNVDGDIVVKFGSHKPHFDKDTGEPYLGRLHNLRNVQEEIPAHIKAYIDERIAELSKPVIDPDVLAVREIFGEFAINSASVVSGLYDDDPGFQAALSAYKKKKHG